MKRIIKLYYPMFFSVLLSFILGFVFKGTLVNFNNYSDKIMWIFVGLTLFMVIAIWVEIIGFIIHAAKNKSLDNRVGWSFLIYFFNIFIIPYYNLKYVVKETKIKSKMIIFSLLLIVSFMAGFLLVNKANESIYITSDNGHIQFEFNGNFIEREVGEYDIYASDFTRGINVGAFIYTENDPETVIELQQLREDWIYSARENVRKIDEYEETFDGKTIISKIYSGKNDNETFIYHISTVEFKKEKHIVNVLEIAFAEDYDSLKEELKEILRNIKYKN